MGGGSRITSTVSPACHKRRLKGAAGAQLGSVESSALVDKRYINLTYFSRGSCVTQVLFRLLPKGETSMSLRTNLCSHMMHWLYNMVCIPSKETSWLLVLQDDATRTCHCKHKLTQGLVITLYNSVCDFEHILTKGSKLEWELRHILVMGVMVLRNLLQREFGLYFECAEEEYQLLISKIQIVSEKLELNSMQRECLTDLLNIEEKNDEEKTEIQEPFDIYWNESANQCRVLLSSRAPSRKQPPKKPRRSIAQINKAWNIAV
ncbi:uncharacterized protein [Anabrus simplex]|uniref:uncharacterized protein n=1 Tax=Anabrus simplex TaxID=316456 RepID=UPI0035A38E08